MLRTGWAGSTTAADHIAVLIDAISQVPAAHRKRLLIRCDGAGASHQLLDWLSEQGQVRGRSVEYSIGFAITEKIREAIKLVPSNVWAPAIDADGGIREGGDVAELTGLLNMSGRPDGMRVIVGRERPHPGAQLSLFEERDGWRYQAFVTNTSTGQLAFLEARHRAHARVEDRIRHAKDSGLGRCPCRELTINQTWLMLAAIAAVLTAWTRLLALTGDARPLRLRAQGAALPLPIRPRPPHSQRPLPTAPDPAIVALGSRSGRGLRQHRRHPRTRLNERPPATRRTRRTAVRQRQPAKYRTPNQPSRRPRPSRRQRARRPAS